MSVNRLQALAREAVYEPDRGIDDEAPEPVKGEAREMLARLNGKRLFYATDERGELVGFGVMEPGGSVRNIAVGLYARSENAPDLPLLRAV